MKKKMLWLSKLIAYSIASYVLTGIWFYMLTGAEPPFLPSDIELPLLPQWWTDYVNPPLAIGIAYWLGKFLGGLYGSIVAPVLVILIWAGIVRDFQHAFVFVLASIFVFLLLEAFAPNPKAIYKTMIRRVKSKTP